MTSTPPVSIPSEPHEHPARCRFAGGPEQSRQSVETSLLTAQFDRADVAYVFAHGIESHPNRTSLARIVPLMDRYAERALLLARERDVVCVAHPVDPAFLEFLHAAGLGPRPENVVVAPSDPASAQDASLPERLLSEPCLVDAIASRLREAAGPVLSPFIATAAESELASRLSDALRRPVNVLGGAPSFVVHACHKHVARAKAVELGVPVAPGEVVRLRTGNDGRPRDLGPVEAAIGRLIGRTGRVLVRGTLGASGSSTFIVGDSPDSVRSVLDLLAARDDNSIYLVDVMCEAAASPNVQTFLPLDGGPPVCVGVTDQRLGSDLTWDGNAFPCGASNVAGMVDAAFRMTRWMQGEGYTGLAGFDFVEYPDLRTGRREFILAEANPRTNGVTYAMALMERLNARRARDGRRRFGAFLSGSLETPARSFCECAARYGHLFLDGKSDSGVFPFNTGCLEIGQLDFVCLGRSRAEAEAAFQRLRALTGEGGPQR